MTATDVSPNRLAAAEAAATHFVDSVPAGTKIGLVAFADSARVVVAPTTDLDAVRNGISNLRLGQGTAIGDAIELALEQLPRLVDTPGAGITPSPAPSTEPAATSNQRSGAIVLLSDGATTSGRPNNEATAQAVAAGVSVTTIAFGTANGHVTIQGQTIPVPVDANALQTIARTTGGQFYTAASADQVNSAYEMHRQERRDDEGEPRGHRLPDRGGTCSGGRRRRGVAGLVLAGFPDPLSVSPAQVEAPG